MYSKVIQEYIPFQANPGKYEILYLHIFWLGLITYMLGYIIGPSGILNIKICQGVQAFGLILMIPKSIILFKAKIDSKYLRNIFIFYLVWHIAIIFRGRGLSFNYDYIKEFLFGDTSNGIIYFVPLVLLFPRSAAYYRKLFYIISFSVVLFLLLSVLFIKNLLVRGEDVTSQAIVENLFDLSIPGAFILLTYLYHSKKRILLAIISVGAIFLFSVIRARRGLILISSSLSFYSGLLYFFNTKKKLPIIYISILLFLFTAVYVSSVDIKKNKLVSFLYERGNEDTRTPVELYFYADMTTQDWIIGKGITGSYFCPRCDVGQETKDYRPAIETGYLQLILKGGLISLGLLLLITLPAITKGIFYSNNIFSKAAGIWILQFTVNLYPQNPVAFNFSYFIVWLAVGICYSKEIRRMSNEEIRDVLLSVKVNKRKKELILI